MFNWNTRRAERSHTSGTHRQVPTVTGARTVRRPVDYAGLVRVIAEGRVRGEDGYEAIALLSAGVGRSTRQVTDDVEAVVALIATPAGT